MPRGSPRRSRGSRRPPRGCRGTRRPCWRRTSSSSREPANSRWVCGSIRPGCHRSTGRVDPCEPGERQAVRLELGLDRRLARRRRRSAPPTRRRPVHRAMPGPSASNRATSPWRGPRRTPPASVTISLAPTMSRPGVASPGPPAFDDAERAAAHVVRGRRPGSRARCRARAASSRRSRICIGE